jgi:hypothetical protein
MAKTMDLNAIAKKTGRVPASILKTALRLGISIKDNAPPRETRLKAKGNDRMTRG